MKKILLVEDDDLLNKTLTYNLISEGYDTASALNAGTAAELLTQTEYDLVLLDINLLDGSGYDLCRMNIVEGMCHAFFAALTVLILGLPLSVAVCAEVSKKSFAGTVVPYQFPFLQMGLFLLVLFGMEVILSVWMVRRQKKQSLVEQMRA